MVVSVNQTPPIEEFSALLNATVSNLNEYAIRHPLRMKEFAGSKLEPYVLKVMSELAVGTNFENSIELISGQRFPDVIAKRFYGIEVKTTTGNHWVTTGNSVLESTRVEGIERIFMLFGKLADPIEFRSKKYEDCLSEVVVTHSPRYKIDMELNEGQTIFDKMAIPYDQLRSGDPIKTIKEYYRRIALAQGNDVWWIDNEITSNIIIRLWNTLSQAERNIFIAKAFVYFPEILSGDDSKKYNRFVTWLTTSQNVIHSNVRDSFSAGGREKSISLNNQVYEDVPRVLVNLIKCGQDVYEILRETNSRQLSDFWSVKTNENKKVDIWLKLAVANATTLNKVQHINIVDLIKSSISR